MTIQKTDPSKDPINFDNILEIFVKVCNHANLDLEHYEHYDFDYYLSDCYSFNTKLIAQYVELKGEAALTKDYLEGGFGRIKFLQVGDFQFVIKFVEFDDEHCIEGVSYEEGVQASYNECKLFEYFSKQNAEHFLPIYGFLSVIAKPETGLHSADFAIVMPVLQTMNSSQSMDIIEDEVALTEMLRQIVLGLQSLHNLNIVHKDIKLDNIFYSENYANGTRKYYLGDFGVSQPLENATCELIKSTQIHVADWTHENIFTYDFYCLGKAIKYVSTGETENPSYRGYSPAFRAIVEKLIQKDPAQNYQSCAEILSDIDAYIHHLKGDVQEPVSEPEKIVFDSSEHRGRKVFDSDEPIDKSYLQGDQFASKCVDKVVAIRMSGVPVSAENLQPIMEDARQGYAHGNKRCQRILTYCYMLLAKEDKLQFAQYIQQALDIIEDNLREDDFRAQTWCGYALYFKTKGTVLPVETWKKAANLGYAPAQFLYAWINDEGHMGLRANCFTGAKYYKMAFDNGFDAAAGKFCDSCIKLFEQNKEAMTTLTSEEDKELLESFRKTYIRFKGRKCEDSRISFIRNL